MTPVMHHTSLALLLWRSRSCSSRIAPIAADARALRCALSLSLSPSPRRRASRPQQRALLRTGRGFESHQAIVF
jgi:hypothetical protein